MEWLYNNLPISEDILDDYYGFVYEIENLSNNRKYIGKKFLFAKKTTTRNGKKKRSIG